VGEVRLLRLLFLFSPTRSPYSLVFSPSTGWKVQWAKEKPPRRVIELSPHRRRRHAYAQAARRSRPCSAERAGAARPAEQCTLVGAAGSEAEAQSGPYGVARVRTPARCLAWDREEEGIARRYTKPGRVRAAGGKGRGLGSKLRAALGVHGAATVTETRLRDTQTHSNLFLHALSCFHAFIMPCPCPIPMPPEFLI
jgi:hypothetical protein